MLMKPYIVFQFCNLCNGTVVDCLDLFLWCHKHGIDINFGIILGNNSDESIVRDLLYTLYVERYHGYISEEYYNKLNNTCINIMRTVDIAKDASKIVVFDYNTLKLFADVMPSIKACFISNIVYELNALEFDEFSKKMKNTVFFGERPYWIMCNTYYRQKYLLDGLKMCYHPVYDRKPLIVCPGLSENEFWDNMQSGRWKYIINKDALSPYLYRGGSTYIPNLINTISEIFYFKSPIVHDKKPRLMLEAQYLGIHVEYYTDESAKGDGSTLRYMNGLAKEIVSRTYTYNDDVIKYILNA